MAEDMSSEHPAGQTQQPGPEQVQPGMLLPIALQMGLPQVGMVAAVAKPDGEQVIAMRLETVIGMLVFHFNPDDADSLGKLLRENARAAKIATTSPLTVIDRSKKQ